MSVFEFVFEHAPDAILLVDGRGRIRAANPEVELLTGWTRDELVGRSVECLVPERLAQRHADERAGMQARGEGRPMGSGLQLQLRHRDGSEIPVDIMLKTDLGPDGPLTVAVVRDLRPALAEEKARAALVGRLERAKRDLRVLGGLLPVCAHCRRVRDDAGRWWEAEDYLERLAGAEPEPGICPDCAARGASGVVRG